jgi:hypothetical protein
MKNFFILFIFAILASIVIPTALKTNESRAQLVTALKPDAANDTLTNTDTAWIYLHTPAATNGDTSRVSIIDNIARSVQANVTKVSGTVGGTVSFEGSIDGTNWDVISTYTITNTTGTQIKVFPLRNANGDLLYKHMRLVFLSTGTQVIIPKAYYLRRSN